MNTLAGEFNPRYLDPMDGQEIFQVKGHDPEGNDPYPRTANAADAGTKVNWLDGFAGVSDGLSNILDSLAPVFGGNKKQDTSTPNNQIIIPEKKNNTGLIVGISIGAVVLIAGLYFFLRKKK